MKDKFIDFLIEMNAFDAWETNTENNREKSADEFLDSADTEHALGAAFHWADTKEGLVYWRDLDERWKFYYPFVKE